MTRTTLSLVITLSIVAATLASCGDDDNNRPVVCDSQSSANAEAGGLCRVWQGDNADSYEQICTQQGGSIVSSCTADNRVGRCRTDQGFGVGIDYVYYAPKFDPTSAQTHCENLASCSFSCVFSP